MSDLVSGARVGQYVMLVDQDGMRHAIRLGGVLAASDGDADRASTVLQLPGGRSVMVHASLDEVLGWFH